MAINDNDLGIRIRSYQNTDPYLQRGDDPYIIKPDQTQSPYGKLNGDKTDTVTQIYRTNEWGNIIVRVYVRNPANPAEDILWQEFGPGYKLEYDTIPIFEGPKR